MTWSESFPNKADEIESTLLPNLRSSGLEDYLLDEVERICDREHEELEKCANKYESIPDNDGEYALQARRVVNTANDKNRFDVTLVDEMFSTREDPELNDFERKFLKSILGLLILQNGCDESTGIFS